MMELTACSLDVLVLNSGLDNGGIDIMQFRYPWVWIMVELTSCSLDILLNSGLDNGGIDIMQFRYPWVEQWFG